MADFTLHTPESAPEGSKPLLENSLKSFGFVPNLHAVMAEAPSTLEAYQQLGGLFSRSSLSAVEQNVVWLTINVEHNCHYCVPAHTGIAHMQNVPADVIDALREERELPDPKLEALRAFTLSTLRNRGIVDEADVEAFLGAGYTRANILDVILGLSHKVLSNYVNHFADTPVDECFKQFDWTPREPVAAE